MKKHAALIAPKFEIVLNALEKELSDSNIAVWTKPKGGYFISLDVQIGSAKRVWQLMNECGVKMTGVGATFPYGNDPQDSNLRIAPTYPPVEELAVAVEVLICCIKIAALEALLA
jgi:DNA-binding transcriptional MocR family regulator